MATIILVIHEGFGARVLLQTEVLDTLLNGGVRVVVLTSDAPTVRRYLEARGLAHITVEQLHLYCQPSGLDGILRKLFRTIRTFAVDTKSVDDMFEMQWKDTRRRGSWVGLYFLAFSWLISHLMRSSALIMKSVVGLENQLDTPRLNDAFFDKYRPEAVVLTSLGTSNDDHYLMREAKRHGAQVISYVLNWDHTSIAGLGVNLSDQIIVWSRAMKDELVKWHRLPSEAIAIKGVPHYDFYVNGRSHIMSKVQLGKQFNFDPAKRLLFLGTKSPNAFLYNVDVAEAICKAIIDGCLPDDCHLIARLHPIYHRRQNGRAQFMKDLLEWEALLRKYGHKCLSVDSPTRINGDLNYFMPDEEIPKLASLLKHSNVVVNMFSTLNLEASIFGTPTVNVAFDFTHKQPPGSKVARFNIHYDEVQTHNQRIIKSGGTMVAHSVDIMIGQINEYLQNPSLHAEERKQIVTTECDANLGHAGRAVGETILRFVENLS